MKAFLIATTLMFGTAAMAQDAGSQMPPANQSTPTDATAPAAPMDTTMSPSDNAGQPSGNTPTSSAPLATDTSNYPPCSRTVTDKCISGGSSGTAHKAMRHHSARK